MYFVEVHAVDLHYDEENNDYSSNKNSSRSQNHDGPVKRPQSAMQAIRYAYSILQFSLNTPKLFANDIIKTRIVRKLMDATTYEVKFRLIVFIKVFLYHMMFYTTGPFCLPIIIIFENYQY